ncbi:restriction endonuclease subunit S [Pseudoalteromonas sp. CO348]|uniref:restriction endonuclease subunit S n=1 Tax=Pseudoalteromonas sp. CO348 TaxID=1777271 RepID=UPI001023EE54|nr:restriction endonuclease subunit S [Pseudoalteromonas sp. CO348]RZG04820.1 restriction endonuclease subunit S [Pseudoalteromonas sp. CO348]
MGRYKEYQEYKNSEVEWLGKVPLDWDIKKIKYLSPVKRGASPRPIDDPKYFDEEGDYAWVRIADVSASDTYLYQTTQKMSELGSSLSVKLEPNQLFLSIAGTVGKPCINKIKACIHDGFVYFPDLKIPNKFLYYVFAGEQAYKGLGKMGTQLNLNTDTVGGIKVAIPKAEKDIQTIINFLDYETTKIDTLIEKQQQLIKLLKEKRQAVISHAVTKGLNPDAPMKDSGVEWLGEVPEHWDIKKAKYLFEFVTSGSRGWAEHYSDEGQLFFRIANLTRDTIEPKMDSIQNVSPPIGAEGQRSKIKLNDLLISITADLGSVCVANGCVEGGYVSQHVSLCRPNSLVKSSRWLAYFVLSDSAKDQLLSSGYGGTKVQLSLEDIRELVTPFPPENEQIEIADYIDSKLIKFESLMTKADEQVQLLKERRTALISAAVTGKIDVRSWKKLEVNEEEVA